ncbi:hypothetical protein ACFL6C_12695 [Myxococcota bacterium]
MKPHAKNKWPVATKVALIVSAGACTQLEMSRRDLPCAIDNDCIDGWVCNPAEKICVPAGELCRDEDGDRYGEGPGCLGEDCDEAVAGCHIDCQTDTDRDGQRDCDDQCVDVDGDGFGIGEACAGGDCDDTSSSCNVNCNTDADQDGILDCDDPCVDADNDGYGQGDACTGADCHDGAATCTDNCDTDDDSDAIPDCQDTCVDTDGDGYGNPGGGANTCIGPDCSDDVATCATDCTTDLDFDGLVDCLDTCIDNDGDGYGTDGGGGTCTDSDCDDGVATCTTDCTTDNDGDSIPLCADTCVDVDGDGFGAVGGAGDSCAGQDCSDVASTCSDDCTTDVDGDSVVDCQDLCVDGDGDGAGGVGGGQGCVTDGGSGGSSPCVQGTPCSGADCNDCQDSCTSDCSSCLPSQLTLTADTPVAVCSGSNLSIDLDCLAGAAADISCSAPPRTIHGLATFETGSDGWTDASSGVQIRSWDDGFPSTCPDSGRFVRMDRWGSRYMQVGVPINATGYEDLRVTFLVGYRSSPPPGQDLALFYCCGTGCAATLLVGAIPNADDGGTDDCRPEALALPSGADDCSALTLRFGWPFEQGRVGIDDIALTGRLSVPPPTELGRGWYSTTVESCASTNVGVTCTWDDGASPSRSDTTTVVFEP